MNIRLDAVHVTRTYGGCYEGCPSYDESVETAKRRAARMFGEHRPVLVLDPLVTRTRGGARLLPDWEITLSLESEALNGGDGSHLIVVTWAADPQFEIQPFIERIDWKASASDYEF